MMRAGDEISMSMSYCHNEQLAGPYVYSTYTQLLDINAKLHPEKEAFVFYNATGERTAYTFKDLSSKSSGLARVLQQKYNIVPGCRIAIVASNSPLFVLAELATWRLGATVVFPPVGIKGGEDLIRAMRLTNCMGIVCDFEYIEDNTVPLLFQSVSSMRFAVTLDEVQQEHDANVVTFAELAQAESLEGYDQIGPTQGKLKPDDPAVVFFTSGTTGDPKAVVFTQFSLVNSVIRGSKEVLGLGIDDVIFVNHPFTHQAAHLFSIAFTSCVGTKTVTTYTRESVVNANTRLMCDMIETERCRAALLYGVHLHDITSFPDIRKRNLSSLRLVITTGQPLHSDQALNIKTILPQVFLGNVYGATELCPVVASDPREAPPADGFIGRVYPGTEIKVVDEEGLVVSRGTSGELCIRSPYVNMGYMVETTIERMCDAAGWVNTGDYAVMNEQGLVRIEGRKKDIIKRIGLKVVPSQIEKVLIRHKKVANVQVIGIPDPRLHEDICACVVKADPTLTEDELRSWCQEVFRPDTTTLSLAPTYFIFMDAYPTTPSGKISKKQVREWAIKHLRDETKI